MPSPVAVTITVPLDVDSVFAFLDVMGNHESFNDHLMTDWELSGPESGVGSKARVHTRALGTSDVVDLEVIDCVGPTRIVERNVAQKAGRTGQGIYTLTSLPDGGTRIDFEYSWIVTPTSIASPHPSPAGSSGGTTRSRCVDWPTSSPGWAQRLHDRPIQAIPFEKPTTRTELSVGRSHPGQPCPVGVGPARVARGHHGSAPPAVRAHIAVFTPLAMRSVFMG